MSLKSARLASLLDKIEAEVERIDEKIEKEVEEEEKVVIKRKKSK